MKKIYAAILFCAAALAVCSCVGLKEQEDPEIYSVISLETEPVEVSKESLTINFGAKFEAGAEVSGEKTFVYSKKPDFSSAASVPAGEDFTAEAMLKDYGETVYLKSVFSNGRNKVESEPVSFSILPFGEYVKLTCPELSAVSDKSANVSASVDFAEGIVPDKLGFEFSESEVPFNVSATAESALYDGVMTAEFSSLTPGSTYYVRSFFREGANTVYSNVLTFCTDVSLPSLAIPSITGVSFDSALASSEVLSDGGDEITEQGFVFSLSQDPNLENATKVISTDKGVGKFSVTLQELAPGKLYYIKSFATNSKGTAYSLETSFKTGVTLPTVTTTDISAITSSSAKSGGTVTADGGSEVTARGVVWSEIPSPTTSSSRTSDGTGTGAFVSSMSALKPGTKYYVRAYASNAAGTAYGEERSFTTDIALPVVMTSSITDITSDSAKGGGSITSDGGSEITAKGVVWSTSQNPTVSLSTRTTDGTGVSTFTSQITGLTPGKTYYVRAYATNAKGTAYGVQVSFKAGTLPPSVTTSSVSSITSSSATCGGNVTNDGGASITARGVVWSTEHNPTTALSTKTLNGTGTGTFSSTITGLAPGKTYYVRAYSTNVSGTAYGEERSFTTEIALPVVVTTSITDITSDSAKGGGSITSDGGSEITAKGIVWSTSQNPTVSLATMTMDGTGTSAFTSSITGLTPGVTYYVRAYATNAKGTAYGAQVSFSAGKTAPSVLTGAVSNISSRSATCGGEVTFNGGSPVSSRGVVWSLQHEPTVTLSTKTIDGSGDGVFSSSITGMAPGKTYYVRAYATNMYGTSYGEERTFTSDIELPVVITSSIKDITSNSAKGGGSISFDGGSQITAKGVVWSTSQNPTASLATKTTDGTGTSTFTSSITGLIPGVTYYVRAYATNAKGTAYGEQESFKAGTEAPTLTTTSVTGITSSSAVCGGNITFDGGASVSARGVVWSTEHNPTTALSTKTSNGTGTGSFSSTITGLDPGKTYYVRAYATNASGTAYGEEKTFTTDIALPVVVTSSITDITSDSAKGGGSITSDGSSEITAKGVVWSTSQNPTISLATKTVDGTGTSAFTSSITGLTPGTTYYVRAYATNAKGTVYGEQVSFKTAATLPRVSTNRVFDISASTAKCDCEITYDGGGTISSSGVVYGTGHNPVLGQDSSIANSGNTNNYTINIQGLSLNTTYYVRAYVVNEAGTSYGNELSFSTDGEYVDLGLSVLWATTNLGATTPEEIGDYYAFGETEKKYSGTLIWRQSVSWQENGWYDREHYKWYGPIDETRNGYTKYVAKANEIIQLELADDAAYVNLGGQCRTPTAEELAELVNNTVVEIVTFWYQGNNSSDGYYIKAYQLTSNIQGYKDKSIILPAGSYVNRRSITDVTGSFQACYMSSSRNCDGMMQLHLYPNSNYENGVYIPPSDYKRWGGGYPYYGYTIRPVKSK